MRTLITPILLLAALPALLRSQTIHWEPVAGLYGGVVNALAFSGDVMVAASGSTVYRSFDGGRWWQPTGLDAGSNGVIYELAASGSSEYVFAAAYRRGLFVSSDRGASWSLVDTTVVSPQITSVAFDDGHGRVYAVGLDSILHISSDNGTTWSRRPMGSIGWANKVSVDPIRGHVYADARPGLMRSTDQGQTWQSVHHAHSGRVVVAPDGTVYASPYSAVLRSGDGGTTWDTIAMRTENHEPISAAVDSTGKVYMGTLGGGLYAADGDVWVKIADAPSQNTYALHVAPGNHLFSNVTYAGIYRYEPGTQGWVVSDDGIAPTGLSGIHMMHGDHLIANINHVRYSMRNAGSSQWMPLPVPADTTGVAPLMTVGGGREIYVYVNRQLYRSTDYGQSWQLLGKMPDGYPVFEVHHDSSGALLMHTTRTLYRSVDQGASFTVIGTSTLPGVLRIPSSGNYYRAAGSVLNHNIYRSTTNGATWDSVRTQPIDGSVNDLVVLNGGNLMLAATSRGIHRWEFSGGMWSNDVTLLDDTIFYDLAVVPGGAVVLVGQEHLYASTDQGRSWQNAESGLPGPQPKYLLEVVSTSRGELFLASAGHGLFRSASVAGVESGRGHTVETPRVHPNPASSLAGIDVQIAAPGDVRVGIYHIDGTLAEMLHDGFLPAGEHSLRWDASGYPAGVYIYRVEAPDMFEHGRIILIR